MPYLGVSGYEESRERLARPLADDHSVHSEEEEDMEAPNSPRNLLVGRQMQIASRRKALFATASLIGCACLIAACTAGFSRPAATTGAVGGSGGALIDEHMIVPPHHASPQYRKLENTFCQHMEKIQPVLQKVDAVGCKQRCDSEPKCGAYMMFQNKDDCVLLAGCQHPGHSSVGSYVMMKLAPNQQWTPTPAPNQHWNDVKYVHGGSGGHYEVGGGNDGHYAISDNGESQWVPGPSGSGPPQYVQGGSGGHYVQGPYTPGNDGYYVDGGSGGHYVDGGYGGQFVDAGNGGQYFEGGNGGQYVVAGNGGHLYVPQGGLLVEHDGGRYVVPQGGQFVEHDGGRYIVPQGGRLVEHDGGHFAIPQGGHLVAYQGHHFVVPAGGRVVVHEGHLFVVPAGGHLVVHDGHHYVVPQGGRLVVHQAQVFVVPAHQEIAQEDYYVPEHEQYVVPEHEQYVVPPHYIVPEHEQYVVPEHEQYVVPVQHHVFVPHHHVYVPQGHLVVPEGGRIVVPQGAHFVQPRVGQIVYHHDGHYVGEDGVFVVPSPTQHIVQEDGHYVVQAGPAPAVVVHHHVVVGPVGHHDHPYDCEKYVETWATSWTQEKKAWCCTQYYDGCPDFHGAAATFDCRADLSSWTTSWSDEKKSFCCHHYYESCPEEKVFEQHMVTHHHIVVGHGIIHHEQYDCHAEVMTWEVSWGPGKKDYCCNTYYNGCPEMPKYNCEDDVLSWKTSWNDDKKEWCCSNHHVGCPRKELEFWYPKYQCTHGDPKEWNEHQQAWCCATDHIGCQHDLVGISFDCAAAHANFQAAWSEIKKAWCCVNHGIGCPPPPTTTTPFKVGPPTTTTGFVPRFDCEADLNHWRRSWSPSKKVWCCRHDHKGCEPATTTTAFHTSPLTTTTAFPVKPDLGGPAMTTTTPFPKKWTPPQTTTTPFAHPPGAAQTTTTGVPGDKHFDCSADFFNWEIFWSEEKKTWCCAEKGQGCMGREQTTTTPFAAVAQRGQTTTTPFPGEKVVLPEGAVSTSPFPGQIEYDCLAGLKHWKEGWSETKKVWCCAHQGLGCVEGTTTSQFPAERVPGQTTTTAFPAEKVYGQTSTTEFPPERVEIPGSGGGHGGHGGGGNPFPKFPMFHPWNPFEGGGEDRRTTTTPFPEGNGNRHGNGGDSGGDTHIHITVNNNGDTHNYHGDHYHYHAGDGGEGSGNGGGGGGHGGGDRDWQTLESTSCKEAMEFIESDECDPEVLLASVKRTCPIEQKDNEDACRSWFGNIDGMSSADRDKEVRRCISAVRKAAQVANRMGHVSARNAEERALCFQCNVKCKTRRRPQAPVLPVPDKQFPADGSKNHCRPKNSRGEASGTHMRLRREADTLSSGDWRRLRRAMQKMKDSGKLDEYARKFSRGLPAEDPVFMNFQQLPWYRRFIHDFETDMQVVANDCDLTLPYFSACREAGPGAMFSSHIWASDRLGGRPVCEDGGYNCESPKVENAEKCCDDRDRWCLKDGIAADWQVGRAAEDQCRCVNRAPGTPSANPGQCAGLFPALRLTEDFKTLTEGIDALRATLHCGTVPGEDSTMCRQDSAPYDPLFWLDYAFMDRLFFSWQRHHYKLNDIDTTNCYGCEMSLTYYNEPLTEWFGQHDAEHGCIEVPKSDPRTCIAYSNMS